jgi:hypothetical protein
MKRILILLTFLTIGSFTLMAQAPPPAPPATGNNGGTNGFVGGTNGPSSGPIGNGTFILLAWRRLMQGGRFIQQILTLLVNHNYKTQS